MSELDSELDETIREFLVEAQENMEDAYKCLETLEANPEDLEPIRSLFRSIHSIKGAAGFFNFSTLEGVGHFCEGILSKLRDGKFVLTPERQALLYEGADAIDKTIASLVETGKEGEEGYIELIMRLRDDSQSDEKSAPEGASEEIAVEENTADIIEEPEAADAPMGEADEVVEEEIPEEAEDSAPVPPAENESPAPNQVQGTPPAVSAVGGKAASTEAVAPSSGISESSIRVDVSLLDKLMNLVEELVLSRNQILRHISGIDNNDLTNASQVFSLVTSELQEGIMKTRMQPVSTVFSKFPRIVRDIARSCEKEVAFKTEGEETELDRTIIEAIKDPLTHIVRNSVDHGIEKPAERIAAGKSEEGTLFIRAFHEGGQVVIEISDDGAGINTDRVRDKALERGLITQAQLGEMAVDEINNLVMLPGFSTMEVVSNLSGRGVGMDVVKTNIEKIGGTVDLISVRGEGTTLRISIPLTLAIVPALIVTAEGERFAIPQVNLQELVRLNDQEMTAQIEYVSGAETYRLRGDLLPLLRLSEVLELEKLNGGEEPEAAGPPLFAAIGGSAAVKAAVEEFYQRVTADPELKSFFESTDMEWLKGQQIKFLTQALGGPAKYDGQDMKAAHSHLPIKERHFTRVAEHLVAALQELGVQDQHIEKVVSLLSPLAPDIVNTSPEGKPLPAAGSNSGSGKKNSEEDQKKETNILVLASGNTKYGLIVDRVHDIEEVVVKPLSKHLNSVSAYAGATILGDGKVILILDAFGLAEEACSRFDSTKEKNESSERARAAAAEKKMNETQSLLLFSIAPDERFAIPLALISRLEKFPKTEINNAGGKEVIQYRGRILPLLRFEDHLPISPPCETEDEINVIVFNFEGKEVGLVVAKIVDVIDISVNLDQSTFGHHGILGSSIVNDHTTLFLDIFTIVGGVFPSWFENRKTPMSDGDLAPEETTILFVEDSQFFRTIVRSYLEAKNYTVIEAHDGQEAFELLESTEKVDLLLTDVEMPRMNGFELAEKIRASDRWPDLPIMALTSLSSDEDRERGLKAGVDEYCVKLDRTEVLDVIETLIKQPAGAAKAV